MQDFKLEPADKYFIYNKGIITSEKIKILTNLYQPIIGYTAISLYLTFYNDLNNKSQESLEYTHHHLMTNMQLKLDSIIDARRKLEGIGLLKTYLKRGEIDNYVYILYSPLSSYEFFNHPILNIVLYNNIGAVEYEKLQTFYKVPRISLKDYEDITEEFQDVFTSSVNTNLLFDNSDIQKDSWLEIQMKSNLDIDLLISSIPKRLVSDKCFSEETKKLILNLAYIYKIDNMNMQGLVRNSLNERGMIDKNELRKSARNFYQFENNGRLPTLIYNKQPDYLKKPAGDHSKWAKMVYAFENLTPYQFLKAKYKGAEPTDRDKRLIENLLVDQKLNPGVVNVLIAYVLKINHEQLKKSYVEAIAGQWKRLNIETVEDAMKIAEKEHKKVKKAFEKNTTSKKSSTKKEASLPAWFDKELENEKTTEEEVAELNKILEELV